MKNLRWLNPLFVLICLALSLQAPSQGEDASLRFVRNGRFSAENGQFLIVGSKLHVYSQVPRVRGSSGERKLEPLGDELRPKWRGESFYHEVYQLKDGKWNKESREFSNSPENYVDFGPCDPFNQLDLSSRENVSFPKAAVSRIKNLTEIHGRKRFAIVVYSDTPEKSVSYSLKIGVGVLDGGAWRLTKTLEIGDYGSYCGGRVGETRVEGRDAWVVFVYVNEPAASSDFNTVYTYLVETSRPQSQP